MRLIGKPGEIRVTYTKWGERILTKYGDDGYAIRERHETDHGNGKKHSNPHDHIITWENNEPKCIQINYEEGKAPEFKKHQGGEHIINKNIQQYDDDMFKTIDEFKHVLSCGGEIEFIWKGTKYGAFGRVCETDDGPERILVCEGYYQKDGKHYNQSNHKEIIPEETYLWCDTPDEALEYILGGDRLRDVITQVEVLYRTI